MSRKEIFNIIVAYIGSILTYVFGAWDTSITVLFWFIGIDYITGLISAAIRQQLNSNAGFKGILRKATILIVLIVAVLLDRLLNQGTWVFRTLICYFYIANEGISILENCSKSGVPMPPRLIGALEQLKRKGE